MLGLYTLMFGIGGASAVNRRPWCKRLACGLRLRVPIALTHWQWACPPAGSTAGGSFDVGATLLVIALPRCYSLNQLQHTENLFVLIV